MGISKQEYQKRIIIIPQDLSWLGERTAGSNTEAALPYVSLKEVLGLGKFDRERLFDGRQSHETCYICYSSGTTGKPKGVEVRFACTILLLLSRQGFHRLPISISQPLLTSQCLSFRRTMAKTVF
jgi:long-subunit acyl-CoA synthetase (AMP-forming)